MTTGNRLFVNYLISQSFEPMALEVRMAIHYIGENVDSTKSLILNIKF